MVVAFFVCDVVGCCCCCCGGGRLVVVAVMVLLLSLGAALVAATRVVWPRVHVCERACATACGTVPNVFRQFEKGGCAVKFCPVVLGC